jgi:hypothetical protein
MWLFFFTNDHYPQRNAILVSALALVVRLYFWLETIQKVRRLAALMKKDLSLEERRVEMGRDIVKFEGRYKNGKLQVYYLPAEDGGGSYEVAGINDKYHPKKAKELKKLCESGQNEKAETEAAKYIEEYTRSVLKFFPEGPEPFSHIEFVLRDSAFNRGAKGAATILQIALGVPVDGVIGPQSKEAFAREMEEDPDKLLEDITAAREVYERNSYPWKKGKRDESSQFWNGLENRWAKAHEVAGTYV